MKRKQLPGGREGDADNRHRGANQWLFVISGRGTARVDKILNTGRTPLRTLNIYVPPAYQASGDPLPRGQK